MGRGEFYTGFWLGNLKRRKPLERPKRRRKDNIKLNLREMG
jgi:hypothetical protein